MEAPRVIHLSLGCVIFLLAVAGCSKKDDPALAFVTAGAPSDGLAASVRTADLTQDKVIAAIPARVRELAKSKKEPRAAGVMLRALAVAKKEDAAALGCELLDTLPELAPWDMKADRPFVDAALIAIAHGKGACADKLVKRLGKDRCLPVFRCKDGGRLPPGGPTEQMEPLCSADDLAKEVEAELQRPKAAVLDEKDVYYTERWALAGLRALGAVPKEMELAHARRQYALTQVATPECGMGVNVGTPCHTDEASIRDQMCRSDNGPVSFSFVKFEFSDEKKTLFNVVESSPP